MKIIVYINQVSMTSDENSKSFINNKLNSENISLIDMTLNLKEKVNGTVTVITTGQSKSQLLLREALARGCDDAILIEDITFGADNSCPTSLLISTELQRIDFDIIITGYRTLDGISAYIGPQIAERLNIPQISYVKEILVEKDKLIANRQIENIIQLAEVPVPCLLTLLNSQESSRTISVMNINKAFEKEIKLWSHADITSFMNCLNTSIVMPRIKVKEKNYSHLKKKCKIYDLIPLEDAVDTSTQSLISVDDAVNIIIDNLKEKSII